MDLIEIVPLLFIGEIAVILLLYRFILRNWIVDHWENKIREDGWLIEMLEPVIIEIENNTAEMLIEFRQSFLGTLGKMTSEAKKLDPMNNMRKAAKDGDWTSMLLEYVTNKSGLGNVLPPNTAELGPKEVENKPKFGQFK